MADFLEPLATALSQFGWRDAVDIVIMSFITYAIVKVLSRTRAMRVVLGLAVILVFAWVAQLLDLATVQWVFSWLLQASAVFIVILFQPELRRALEKLGRGRIFDFTNLRSPNSENEELIRQFMNALENMAKGRVGAILVFERKTGLADIVESGIPIDADVSAQLIETIFYPNNPLHDGAMIIKNGRIWAAGCFLPLSANQQISSKYGTRHRASLGVSEVSDAYVLVVSEERGTISFVYDGMLNADISTERLRGILEDLYAPRESRWFSRTEDVDLSAHTKEINTNEIREADKAEKDRIAREEEILAANQEEEREQQEIEREEQEDEREKQEYEREHQESEREKLLGEKKPPEGGPSA